MESRNFNYNVRDLGLSAEKIIKLIGYTTEDVPDTVTDLVVETLKVSLDLPSVKAEYHYFDSLVIDKESASIMLSSILFQTRKIILSQLKGSTAAVLFLATAGPELGELSKKQMASGKLLEGYITDVVGSEVVEAAIDLMHKELGSAASEEGYNITNRFSPGYCGWDVAEQHKLFDLIPENYCGITLTDSALMSPVKSVSGLIGIGREARFRPYSCSRCDADNCLYRNKK